MAHRLSLSWRELLSLGVGLLVACSSGSGSPGASVTGVTVTASPPSIAAGVSSTLTATVTGTGSFSSGVTWTVSPGGGTLTPSGSTATFSSTTVGSYTVTATSTADTTKAGSAQVTVTVACGTANGTEVHHQGTVTASETWVGDGVTHVIDFDMQINAGGTVTIQPCAIVALKTGTSITVSGNTSTLTNAKLVAAGTSDSRFVTFQPFTPGQKWNYIRATNENSLLDFTFTIIAGGGNPGSNDSAVYAQGGTGLPSPTLRVNNVVINAGIFLNNTAFTPDSQALRIQDSLSYPVTACAMALGSIPAGEYLGTGNAIEEVLTLGNCNSEFYADLTIPNRLPIRFRIGSITVGPRSGSAATSVTLTLQPGVVMRLENLAQPGAFIKFGQTGQYDTGGQPNNKVGRLVALGTAAQPITFTSGYASPAAGDWQGLWLATANGSQLDHVIIEYAGAPNGMSSGAFSCRPSGPGTNDDAALVIGDFTDQYVPPSDLITNSTLQHNAGFGINAVWVTTGYSPDLTGNGNTFSDNAGCNQTLNKTPAACPVGGGCQP